MQVAESCHQAINFAIDLGVAGLAINDGVGVMPTDPVTGVFIHAGRDGSVDILHLVR